MLSTVVAMLLDKALERLDFTDAERQALTQRPRCRRNAEAGFLDGEGCRHRAGPLSSIVREALPSFGAAFQMEARHGDGHTCRRCLVVLNAALK